MQIIDIFKTNVQNKKQAEMVTGLMKLNFKKAEINFDLEDYDRIMRVRCDGSLEIDVIVKSVNKLGFTCEELD